MNYFQGNQNHPQHLSVGGIVIKDSDESVILEKVKNILDKNKTA